MEAATVSEPKAAPNGHAVRSVLTRLTEAAIIGGILMYGTVQMLGVKIDSISSQVSELKQDVRKMRDDFYRPQFSQAR